MTFLLHEGLERVRIRKHLLVFSLAAPVMALLTYFGLGQVSMTHQMIFYTQIDLFYKFENNITIAIFYAGR